MDPDIFFDLAIIRTKGISKGNNHLLDPGKSFPGIGKLAQIISCQQAKTTVWKKCGK